MNYATPAWPCQPGWRLRDLVAQIGGRVKGDDAAVISGVAPIHRAGPGALTFLADSRHRKHLATTAASAVILSEPDMAACPTSAWVVDDPHVVFARAVGVLYPAPAPQRGTHATAWVSPGSRVDETAWVGPYAVVEADAEIAGGVQIGPHSYVGEGVVIGEASRLVARVVICHGTRIGKRVLIYPGAVIGSDGFGLARDGHRWVRVPQVGGVVIGDDVEVGANTTIDRGAIDDTVIEDGVKLDNQIQVGHNVHVGAHTAVAGCVGIAGGTRVGRRCAIGGGVGIGGHLDIADDVRVTGMSMVTRSLNVPGTYSSGIPAQTNRAWRRSIARFRQLDEFARRLKVLEEMIASHG